MERREYLLSELPDDIRKVYERGFGVPLPLLFHNDSDSFGLTFNGLRYRVYKDAAGRQTAKSLGVDLLDALKGADIPPKQIETAMDRLKCNAEEREQLWMDIFAVQHDGYIRPEKFWKLYGAGEPLCVRNGNFYDKYYVRRERE